MESEPCASTDPVVGQLSRADRDAWLRNYSMPDSMSDEEILEAIGSGIA